MFGKLLSRGLENGCRRRAHGWSMKIRFPKKPTQQVCLVEIPNGKMRRASFRPKPESSISPRIGKIHSDVCSVDTPSFGGSQHFITFTDEKSKFRKIYFLKSKDEVPDIIDNSSSGSIVSPVQTAIFIIYTPTMEQRT